MLGSKLIYVSKRGPKAPHIPLLYGPEQVKLSVRQVDLSQVFLYEQLEKMHNSKNRASEKY